MDIWLGILIGLFIGLAIIAIGLLFEEWSYRRKK